MQHLAEASELTLADEDERGLEPSLHDTNAFVWTPEVLIFGGCTLPTSFPSIPRPPFRQRDEGFDGFCTLDNICYQQDRDLLYTCKPFSFYFFCFFCQQRPYPRSPLANSYQCSKLTQMLPPGASLVFRHFLFSTFSVG